MISSLSIIHILIYILVVACAYNVDVPEDYTWIGESYLDILKKNSSATCTPERCILIARELNVVTFTDGIIGFAKSLVHQAGPRRMWYLHYTATSWDRLGFLVHSQRYHTASPGTKLDLTSV